ncbi:tRNA (guanine37-N1)-methyltransferase [Scopulibacillus daqui]|uniref:tRNA (guanine-N(1)-)-methyltransferase n=1 Tax=Scopulibacillus daqui TaxID=1469162 RepID=A0ABS2PXA4_9BACL|nr:tRNA (guanosine(37)-N1)-methyltransferase TrmD [Scopulibacillus daqui]MBM7644335.1 tRNA (guanine37-N1)-methyltransferase [Scopulibacillus daqui]
MRIDVLSLFPEMYKGVLEHSILKKAADNGAFTCRITDFRQYADNKHQRVDDYTYGGGAGMLLMPQPIFDAVEAVTKDTGTKPRIIMMTPQGTRYNQRYAEELAKEDHLIFLCGHYEGFDERIRQSLVTDEISIGDYVLTGGELASMVVMDSVIRLLPGVLGNEVSAHTDSFSNGLLEHPQYTRPADFRGMKVPDVLLSGNHKLIEEWRHKESLRRTLMRRPDLLENRILTDKEKEWLQEIKQEIKNKD